MRNKKYVLLEKFSTFLPRRSLLFKLHPFLLSLFFSHSLFALSSSETPIVKYLKPIEITEQDSGIGLVDCIYVINLDERPEKWERMKILLNDQGLKANRVSGINGWKIPKEVKKELVGPYPIRLRGGHFGCLLSHVSVLKNAYERGFEIIWVCEDDIEFIENAKEIPDLLRKLSKIDPDWDVFYTDIDSKDQQGRYIRSVSSDFRPDRTYPPVEYYTERFRLTEDIMRIRQRFGMYSLLISRKGIKKILDYFTHLYLWTAVDIDIHYIPGIRQYSATRDIVSIWYSSPGDTGREIQ
jgi:GR25 family glycosyltransferase involved in LPS biosynthesis